MATGSGVRRPGPFRGLRLAAALVASAAALAAGDVSAGAAHPAGGHGHGGNPPPPPQAAPPTRGPGAHHGQGAVHGKGNAKPGPAGGHAKAPGHAATKAAPPPKPTKAAPPAKPRPQAHTDTKASIHGSGGPRASAGAVGTGDTTGKGKAAPGPTPTPSPALAPHLLTATPVVAAHTAAARDAAKARRHARRAHARRAHKASHRSARRATTARRLGAPSSARTGALSSAASPPSRSATRATHARAARRHAAKGRPGTRFARPSSVPLLHTITRIVNVVPAPLRVLIAALVGLALAFAVALRLIAVRARRLERQRRALLEDVGLLQAALLPAVPERVGGVRASVAYRPADGPAAGGDFYDVFELADGQVGVIIGDLSGHGRKALPHTSLVRFTLRAHLEAGLSPKLALQSAAPVLERQLGQSFATVIVASYDPRARRLVYATAGHPPPVILGPEPLQALTTSSSPPIGVGWPTGLRQTTVDLPGRAVICFYTDGLVEARTADARYGSDRLERAIADLGSAPSAAEVLERVAAETVERPDDMAACLLELEGELEPATISAEELELSAPEGAPERIDIFLAACGLDGPAIAAAKQAALPDLHRGRSVILQVEADGNRPCVTVSRGEVARLPRSSAAADERRTMAQ